MQTLLVILGLVIVLAACTAAPTPTPTPTPGPILSEAEVTALVKGDLRNQRIAIGSLPLSCTSSTSTSTSTSRFDSRFGRDSTDVAVLLECGRIRRERNALGAQIDGRWAATFDPSLGRWTAVSENAENQYAWHVYERTLVIDPLQ
jgi:hypothetical protein